MHPKILKKETAALVVIDVQEGFRSAIGDFALIASRVSMAVRGFQILDVPVIVTEQYPEGLGRTAEEIQLVLEDNFEVIDKTAFSSCSADIFIKKLQGLGVKQIVLCGLETHICVTQTAHDLIDRGFEVHILTDCVCSRFDHDRKAGLGKMAASGAVSSSLEMALFEMMGDAKHEKFKEIQALIR
ncbi:MAG: hydrolase [Pyrinomonadaceae bacterium]